MAFGYKTGAKKWALAGVVLLSAGAARAQETPEIKALRERADARDVQIKMLMDELEKLKANRPAPAPEAIREAVRGELKAVEEEKKAAPPAAAKEYEVGSDRRITSSRWENDGLHFTSANKDFDIHLGGRLNDDFIWWKQPAYLKAAAPGAAGIPGAARGAGEGAFDDGNYFRRIRTRAEGTMYENLEFQMEVGFENLNRIQLNENWIGLKEIPFLGEVRIGHQRVPQGLESYSSNRYLTTLEQSALTETFNQEFANGIWVGNNYLNERVAVAAMLHRNEVFQQYNGASFGDGDGAFTARVSGLPYYDESGRCYVHTAASYQYRTGNLGRTWGDAAMSPLGMSQNVVRFRDRPEIRDSAGTGSNTQGDSSRIIDTGYLATSGVTTVNGELFGVFGPAYIQAETTVAEVEHARRVDSAAAFRVDHGSPVFWGYYAQVGYFLTGEYRPYRHLTGTYNRVVPNSNFFLVRTGDGVGGGTGAIELVYRFSFDDLNSNGINGGTAASHTVGVNWYWSPNIKVQCNYVNVNRNSVGNNANAGTLQGLGVRTIIDF